LKADGEVHDHIVSGPVLIEPGRGEQASDKRADKSAPLASPAISPRGV
jgi:hypothetical protein